MDSLLLKAFNAIVTLLISLHLVLSQINGSNGEATNTDDLDAMVQALGQLEAPRGKKFKAKAGKHGKTNFGPPKAKTHAGKRTETPEAKTQEDSYDGRDREFHDPPEVPDLYVEHADLQKRVTYLRTVLEYDDASLLKLLFPNAVTTKRFRQDADMIKAHVDLLAAQTLEEIEQRDPGISHRRQAAIGDFEHQITLDKLRSAIALSGTIHDRNESSHHSSIAEDRAKVAKFDLERATADRTLVPAVDLARIKVELELAKVTKEFEVVRARIDAENEIKGLLDNIRLRQNTRMLLDEDLMDEIKTTKDDILRQQLRKSLAEESLRALVAEDDLAQRDEPDEPFDPPSGLPGGNPGDTIGHCPYFIRRDNNTATVRDVATLAGVTAAWWLSLHPAVAAPLCLTWLVKAAAPYTQFGVAAYFGSNATAVLGGQLEIFDNVVDPALGPIEENPHRDDTLWVSLSSRSGWTRDFVLLCRDSPAWRLLRCQSPDLTMVKSWVVANKFTHRASVPIYLEIFDVFSKRYAGGKTSVDQLRNIENAICCTPEYARLDRKILYNTAVCLHQSLSVLYFSSVRSGGIEEATQALSFQ